MNEDCDDDSARLDICRAIIAVLSKTVPAGLQCGIAIRVRNRRIVIQAAVSFVL